MSIPLTPQLEVGVFHVTSRGWRVLGQALTALGVPHLELLASLAGYVPSSVATAWGEGLFAGMGDLVVVSTYDPRRRQLQPAAVYRRPAPPEPRVLFRRTPPPPPRPEVPLGEEASGLDGEVGALLTGVAQFMLLSAGFAFE